MHSQQLLHSARLLAHSSQCRHLAPPPSHRRGGTALHIAAFVGSSGVARALLKSKADASLAHPAAGLTAVAVARAAGHAALLALLEPAALELADIDADDEAAAVGDAAGAAAANNLTWLSSSEAQAVAQHFGPQVAPLTADPVSTS